MQITGEGFDTEWAKAVRKASLLSKTQGLLWKQPVLPREPVWRARRRWRIHELKGYRYLSDALVLADVGMEMRIMGAPAYHPLLEAGVNWYESSASCELILDDIRELVFQVEKLGSKGKKRVAMELAGLPARPNKTTRLSLEMKYISAKDCRITVKDLGFGDMYPTSGKNMDRDCAVVGGKT